MPAKAAEGWSVERVAELSGDRSSLDQAFALAQAAQTAEMQRLLRALR